MSPRSLTLDDRRSDKLSSSVILPEQGRTLSLYIYIYIYMTNNLDRDDRTPESLLEAAWDGGAREAFAKFFVPRLARRLRARYPQDDPELCESAASDAVIAMLDRRTTFDPTRGALDAYQWGVARKKRLKLRSLSKRSNPGDHRAHAIKSFDELNGRELGSLWSEEDDPAIVLERIERREIVLAKIDSIRSKLSIEHNRVLDFILGGERSSSAYEAIFLHITSDPRELRILVKRAKDCVWYHLNSIGVTRKNRSS
jgi:hypothetical protein